MPRVSFAFLLRIGQAFIVAAALGAATYLEVRTSTAPGWAVVLVAVVLGTGGLVDPAVRAWTNEFGQLSPNAQYQIEQPLLALVDTIDQIPTTTLAFRDVGVTAFIVRHSRRHPIRGVQVRVARIRFLANPHPTTIAWSWRKGLLGECWERHEVVGSCHESKYREYVSYSRKQWRAVPNDIRQRLTLADMRAIAHFGYVEAHPMIAASGHYRGCLVVQVLESQEGELAKSEVQDAISVAANTAAGVVAQI